MSRLALFDFDGTITTKDSFIEFIKYYSSTSRILIGIIYLFPKMVLFKLGFIPNWRAKEYVLTWFFKGESVGDVDLKSKKFCEEVIVKLVKKDAILKLKQHKANGDRVVLVSASAEQWLKHWTESMNIELISTKMEIENGQFTGRLDGQNCYGINKVTKIKSLIDITEYKEIYAYGDSRGDKEMLELANHPFYRVFSK